MRVWERGSGVTLACGTGSCAALVAANLCGLAGREEEIELDGLPEDMPEEIGEQISLEEEKSKEAEDDEDDEEDS